MELISEKTTHSGIELKEWDDPMQQVRAVEAKDHLTGERIAHKFSDIGLRSSDGRAFVHRMIQHMMDELFKKRDELFGKAAPLPDPVNNLDSLSRKLDMNRQDLADIIRTISDGGRVWPKPEEELSEDTGWWS